MAETAVEKKRKERVSTVRGLLKSMAPQIEMALPAHMDPVRFLRIAMTSIQKTPKLLECTDVSFMGALIQAAQLGLEPDGTTGQAYLIPRMNRRAVTKAC